MKKPRMPKKIKPIAKKEIERLLQKGIREAELSRKAIENMGIMGTDVRNIVFRKGGAK